MQRFPAAQLSYSNAGNSVTKGFEQCRLIAYIPAPGDVPTIGWGHTKGVRLGMQCTQAEADAWLLQDEQSAINDVRSKVTVPLTQGEFDALVDFAFNCGDGAFEKSTLLRLLNLGEYDLAAAQFPAWDKCGGKVLAGLVRRREAEQEEFKNATATVA